MAEKKFQNFIFLAQANGQTNIGQNKTPYCQKLLHNFRQLSRDKRKYFQNFQESELISVRVQRDQLKAFKSMEGVQKEIKEQIQLTLNGFSLKSQQ